MSEQVPDPAPGEDEVEGGEGVTMLDVLQEEEALEEDAAAVLGNVSDSSCSYSLGYLRRQPLYACRDCCREGESAGVCLACSYHCHEVSWEEEERVSGVGDSVTVLCCPGLHAGGALHQEELPV